MEKSSQLQTTHLPDPGCWVEQYGDQLLRVAASRIRQRDVAEDLVQETFLAAWEARHSFDGRSRFSTWLIGILRRKIADHYRREGKKQVPVEQALPSAQVQFFDERGCWIDVISKWKQTPDHFAENAEFWEIVADCLAQLPAHLAEVFRMRALAFSTTDEICEKVAITPKNLSVRLHRARLLLRHCLDRTWFCKEG